LAAAAPEPRPVEPVTAPPPEAKPKPKAKTAKPKTAARAATQPRVQTTATPVSAPIRTAPTSGAGRPDAQSTAAPSASARPSPAETATGRELEGAYLATLRRTIEARKYYPRQARRARHEGTVKVRFKVLRDGSFETAEVVDSSGSTLLDAAALETLNRVGRFAPFPNGMGKSYLMVGLPLSYELR
jgi:protein TonB